MYDRKMDRFALVVGRLVPDAISAAVILMLIVVAAALAFDNAPARIIDAYYQGLWMLLPFTMQMTLIIVLSAVLGSTSLFRRSVALLSSLRAFRGECTVAHFAHRVALLTALAARRRLRTRDRWTEADTTPESVADERGPSPLTRAIASPSAVLAALGPPQRAGIQPLYRSADLTILNIVWAPLMQLMPHEHRMWAVSGIYAGREDNILWRRARGSIAARGAVSFASGEVVSMPDDAIHSVANPIDRFTGAIHIYGGDFFATPRSEWDPGTHAEQAWSLDKAQRIFAESNARFAGATARICVG